MSQDRRRITGGTLIEVLVALSIFLGFLAAMFVLFEKGYQAFRFLDQRQSVQGQVLRISTALEADFRVSHLGSIGIEGSQVMVDGQLQPRAMVSCLTLNDWRDPANFQSGTGIPKWNRYAVYRSSSDPQGTLERLLIRPSSIPTEGLPVAPLLGLATLTGPEIVGRQTLCQDVLAFECVLDLVGERVLQTLRLRRDVGRRGLDAGAASESFEARFSWLPRNTIPRI